MKDYEKIGSDVGKLVSDKQQAYGDSFGKCHKVVEVLYPNGIEPYQYTDALTLIRVIDKMFRIATKKDAFGESPWRDICGYALLALEREERDAQSK